MYDRVWGPYYNFLQTISMLRLAKRIAMGFTIKNTLKKKWGEFMTVDAGAVLRDVPTTKQRKYKNVEITEDFKKIDEKRKKERYDKMKKRQQLLEMKLKNEQKLLTGPQQSSIKAQLAEIQKSIQESEKEIAQLTTQIESSQAEYMVLEGYMKIGVLNHIKYLEYLHTHSGGYVLHPQTIKAIQNVHYCVNHNLPQLYEMMPDLFQRQIGQLEESVQRLIKEKQIFIEDESEKSSVRFFHKLETNERITQAGHIGNQIQDTLNNVYMYCHKLLDEHAQLIENVHLKKTPFRNLQHMRTVMLSDMPIKYLPEEEALRQALLHIEDLSNQWLNYKQVREQDMRKAMRKYIQPPPFVENHPVLMKKYQQVMQAYMNPTPLEESHLVHVGDQTEAQFALKMEEQIRKVVQQKYDPIFIEAMNSDRSKIDKQKLEIQFYNLSTNIMENLLALQDNSKQSQEVFQKLPKSTGILTNQHKKNLISMDDLTRIIYLNSKDKIKYNVQFFANWFGVEKDLLFDVLNSVSYLRVPYKKDVKKSENGKQPEVKPEILKFQS